MITEKEFDKVMEIGSKFVPLQDRVLVHMLNIKPRTEKLNLEIVQSVNRQHEKVAFDEHPWQGLVIAVGPGYDNGTGYISMEVKVGDHVCLYMPPDPDRETVMFEGMLFGIFRQSNIMGKYNQQIEKIK